MRKLFVAAVSLVLVGVLTAIVSAAVTHRGDGVRHAKLDGYQEVPSKSTRGHGRLAITDVDRSAKTFRFRLEYEDLEGGNVIGAHLHLAQRHVVGDVIVPFCGPCPASPATVTGTITNADIGATNAPPANQGIVKGEATAFEELFRAIRAGAVYVNVHTVAHPGGEIRGQLGPGHGKGFGFGKRK